MINAPRKIFRGTNKYIFSLGSIAISLLLLVCLGDRILKVLLVVYGDIVLDLSGYDTGVVN